VDGRRSSAVQRLAGRAVRPSNRIPSSRDGLEPRCSPESCRCRGAIGRHSAATIMGNTRFSRGSSSAGLEASECRGESIPPRAEELIPVWRRNRRWASARLFAAACLLVVTVGAYVHIAGFVPGGDRYMTPVGGINHVRLADGSQVTLNTDTSIRVILTAGERRVQLERGEAFFEVAKNKARPSSSMSARRASWQSVPSSRFGATIATSRLS